MDKEPRLLVWNYTDEEKQRLDALLQEIGAPCAVTIAPGQGHLLLREILAAEEGSGEVLESEEKVVLFFNIVQKGVHFLINTFKQTELPRPIYAVVTEHSINWPFSELLEHLVQEREALSQRNSS